MPSNGICRGFAFKYGKFLLPPRFLTALSVPKVPTREQLPSFRYAAALISSSLLLFGASFTLGGCASNQEEQRYSWPLATASPEDTVTQLFAEKFAEEVHDLSNGAMRIQVYANSTLGGDRGAARFDRSDTVGDARVGLFSGILGRGFGCLRHDFLFFRI